MLGSLGLHVTTDTTPLVTFNQMKTMELEEIGQSTSEKRQVQRNNWPLACLGLRKAGDSPHPACVRLLKSSPFPMINTLLPLALGCLLGFLVAFLVYRSRSRVFETLVQARERELASVRFELKAAGEGNAKLREQSASLSAKLEAAQAAHSENLAILQRAEQALREAFGSLAKDALSSNSASFLHLAQTKLGTFQSEAERDLDSRKDAVQRLITPINETLGKMDLQVQALEIARSGAYSDLHRQVESLKETQEGLRSETTNLVRALRNPSVRGRWGEHQLRRVLEMAGMLNRCDFYEQQSISGEDDKRLRPDVIVKLPGGKNLVIDAKTPIDAYMNAFESNQTDEARSANLKLHARHVRAHLDQLGGKAYWAELENTPEFVVMFLPGEFFFSAALEHDPSLIEVGVNKQVIIASPTTLIALLKAVAYGWSQETIATDARKISELGAELHERLRVLSGHFEDVGKGLSSAVDSYNKTLSSLESRALVTARKLKEQHALGTKEIPQLPAIETNARLPLGLPEETFTLDAPDSADRSETKSE